MKEDEVSKTDSIIKLKSNAKARKFNQSFYDHIESDHKRLLRIVQYFKEGVEPQIKKIVIKKEIQREQLKNKSLIDSAYNRYTSKDSELFQNINSLLRINLRKR
jgi:hypothetical protein